MTIAPFSSGSSSQGDEAKAFSRSSRTSIANLTSSGEGAPIEVREERLVAQIANFTRAGYRVEQRTHLRAVVVREHKRGVRSRIAEAARTFGVVPLIVRPTRAFHRVLITIDTDGAVRLL